MVIQDIIVIFTEASYPEMVFHLKKKGTLQGLPKAVDAFVMFKPLQK